MTGPILQRAAGGAEPRSLLPAPAQTEGLSTSPHLAGTYPG